MITTLQLIAMEEIHDAFQLFVDRVIGTPEMPGGEIDAAVNEFAASVVKAAGKDAAVILRAAATGTRSGFSALGVKMTPSVANLVARLEIEAASLSGPAH